MSGVLGLTVGAVAGLIAAPLASTIVARPPLMDAPEKVALPFRCDSCHAKLRTVDAVPVLGFVVAGGRCRWCQSRIPAHQVVAELLLVAVGALIGWRIGWSPSLPAHLVLGFVTVCVVIIDYRLHKIPTRLVYPAAGVAAVALIVEAVIDGQLNPLVRAGIGALVASGFLWLLVLFVPAGMGQGDARLCLLLGLLLGWHGWRPLYLGLLAGFMLGSVFGLGVVAAKRLSGRASIRAGMKTQIAFGPYLCVGALIFCLWPTLAG